MASGDESRKQSVFNWLALLGAKEGIDLFVNGSRAFEIGEVSAAFHRDHAGIWNCLSNVLSRRGGNELLIATDNYWRRHYGVDDWKGGDIPRAHYCSQLSCIR